MQHGTRKAGDQFRSARWIAKALFVERATWRQATGYGQIQARSIVAALTAVIAAFLPLFALINTVFIEPATRPPEVLLTVSMAVSSLKDVGNGDRVAAVTVKTGIRNPTGSRIRLLADSINVKGVTIQLYPRNLPTSQDYTRDLGVYYGRTVANNRPEVPLSPQDNSTFLQTISISNYALVTAERSVYSIVPFRTDVGWFLDPAEEDTRTLVFFVALSTMSTFDYLHLEMETYTARESDLLKPLSITYYVDPAGKLKWLTRIARLNGSDDATEIDMDKATAYGVGYNTSMFDLPLWTPNSAVPNPSPQP